MTSDFHFLLSVIYKKKLEALLAFTYITSMCEFFKSILHTFYIFIIKIIIQAYLIF
jgi:hypothetical protein